MWDSPYLITKDVRQVLKLIKVDDSVINIKHGRSGHVIPAAVLRNEPYGSYFRSEKGVFKKRARIQKIINELLTKLSSDNQGIIVVDNMDENQNGNGENNIASNKGSPNDNESNIVSTTIEKTNLGDATDKNKARNIDIGNTSMGSQGKQLTDNNSAQQLTYEEISEMKGRLTTREIIEQLMNNSTSFNDRSLFAKEKYIKRCIERHCDEMQILQPNMNNLLNYYNSREDISKVGGLRPETLGALISRANIGKDSCTLIFDHSKGALTSSIASICPKRLYRVDAKGVSTGVCTETGIDRSLYPEDHVWPINLLETAVDTVLSEENLYTYCENHPYLQFRPNKETVNILIDEANPLRNRKLEGYVIGQFKWKNRMEIWRQFSIYEGVDSFVGVISVSRWCMIDQDTKVMDLPELITLAYTLGDIATRFVQPGGIFVIFCEDGVPLTSLGASFIDSNHWSDVKMERLSVRPWQMQEGRSHPIMKVIKVAKGYILSATKCCN